MTPQGRALIQRFESLRLSPYLDTGGIKTVGYGHRMYPGEFRDSDFPLTEMQANALLDKDIALKSNWVRHYIFAPLNDNQFSALVSLVFNEGVTPLCDTLGKLVNNGSYQEAAGQFDRWVFAEVRGVKVKMTGLVARRTAEKELFLKPTEEVLPWLTNSSA